MIRALLGWLSELIFFFFSANLTMDHAKNLLEDLSKAQGSLNLLTPLHLLYLIIPPDRAEKTRFSPQVFARVVSLYKLYYVGFSEQ
jgi:hypothetical protein